MLGALIILAATAVARITPAGEIHLAEPEVRLGDVAKLEGADAKRFANIIIARLPAAKAMRLEHDEIVQLVRRAVPGLKVTGGGGQVTLVARGLPKRSSAACYSAAIGISAGSALTPNALAPVQCDKRRKAAALAWDEASRQTFAPTEIGQGDYLGPLALAPPPVIRRGDNLKLVSNRGAVAIVRQVRALQDAASGWHRLFVRTEDGTVFSVPLVAGGGK